MARGSVKKRGSSWYYVVDVGLDNEGNRKQKRKGGFRTKKEAEKALSEVLNHIDKGTYIEPEKISVEEYLGDWLGSYGKQNLAPATYESYSNIINNHLKPNLGKIPLQKLLPAHLQSYYAKALKEGRVDNKKEKKKALSPTTVLYHHRVIREALQHAVKLGLVYRNVADATEPPRKTKKEMQIIPEEQVPKLLELFQDTYLYMPVYLALMTGARAGEILALTWNNVDLKNGTISITQSIRQRKAKQPEFQQPKTPGSKRTIEISPLVVKILKEHKKSQVKDIEETEANQGKYAKYNLVCCKQDGNPLHPGSFASKFRKIVRKNGFTLRFHDIRHCHASYLLAAGVNPKIIAERLGHSTVRLTSDTYSHVIPGMQRDAAIQLEERLFGDQKVAENSCDQSVTNIEIKRKMTRPSNSESLVIREVSGGDTRI